jgi:hypothetical protein
MARQPEAKIGATIHTRHKGCSTQRRAKPNQKPKTHTRAAEQARAGNTDLRRETEEKARQPKLKQEIYLQRETEEKARQPETKLSAGNIEAQRETEEKARQPETKLSAISAGNTWSQTPVIHTNKHLMSSTHLNGDTCAIPDVDSRQLRSFDGAVRDADCAFTPHIKAMQPPIKTASLHFSISTVPDIASHTYKRYTFEGNIS